MLLLTSVRVSQRHRRLLFDLPTAKVSSNCALLLSTQLTSSTDANLFKESFIKAQQDNEKLFGQE